MHPLPREVLVHFERVACLHNVFCRYQELLVDAKVILLNGLPQLSLGMCRILFVEGGQCAKRPYNFGCLSPCDQNLRMQQSIT